MLREDIEIPTLQRSRHNLLIVVHFNAYNSPLGEHKSGNRGICCVNSQSMNKAGCPYDNAPMERFYDTLKNEWIYLNKFYSDTILDEATKKYVFVWYNQIRPHSYNNCLTPFEARYT